MYCNSIWYSTRVIIFDKELKFESLNLLSLLVKFEVKLLCYKGSFPSTTHHLSLEDTLSVKVFWSYAQIQRQPICYIDKSGSIHCQYKSHKMKWKLSMSLAQLSSSLLIELGQVSYFGCIS